MNGSNSLSSQRSVLFTEGRSDVYAKCDRVCCHCEHLPFLVGDRKPVFPSVISSINSVIEAQNLVCTAFNLTIKSSIRIEFTIVNVSKISSTNIVDRVGRHWLLGDMIEKHESSISL